MNLFDLHPKPETVKGYEQRLQVPQIAYEKAMKRKNWRGKVVRSPNLEPTIAKDPTSAFNYVGNVIKGRWPEGEEAIAKNPKYAFYYAMNILKQRFPEGEAAIATVPHWAFQYALNVIRGRFPEGEAAIVKNPHYAQRYGMWFGGMS